MWKKIIFETLCICGDVTENKIEMCKMKFKNHVYHIYYYFKIIIILLLFFIPGTIRTILTKFYIYYIQWYFHINIKTPCRDDV